ncbi:MAG: hypothetical protein GY694_16160, partial [Gammaproteobacteria bacterium]|nr:hypothetical protein [Gammaproteobacteria bacterium]
MQTNFIDKSIFTRTYILHFIALFSVISLISGVLVYNGQRIIVDSENQLLQNTENNRLKLVKNITRFYIDQFISDVKFLSKSESLLRFFISRKPRIDKVYVEKEFTKMAKERKVYDQIRFINMHGKEVVRINYNNGDPAIVPERDLQDKSGRYYFQDSLETQYNQVYIS